MKSARKKKEKVKEVSAMQNVKKKQTSQKKSTKCPKERRHKSKGTDENVLSGKEEVFTRSNAIDTRNPSDTVIFTGQSDHIPVTMPHPSAKIKLQLFPVDESVRIGLEKDGYNPYLELTLSPRKKISSVLRHLGIKWGSSNVAQGELMLFPHNVVIENLASYGRWTLNDIGITAGDVHKAVGCPAIFRLRYGWFFKPSSFCPPPVSDSFPLVKESELVEKDLTATFESERDTEHQIHVQDHGLKVHSVTLMDENQTPAEANELKPSNTTELATAPPVELFSAPQSVQGPNKDYGILQPSALLSDLSNISFGTLLSKVSPQGKPNQPSAMLSDLSNISFGALLSETSLQGKPNQPSTLLSDRSTINVGALLSEASLQGKPNQPSTMLSDLGNTSFGALLSEASLQGKPNQPPTLLSDLSNISIGGLLSEASLQGKPNFFNTKLNESRSAFSQLFTDSLDAFFSNQLKSTQDLKTSHSSPSSIFDTEVACDSFSFRKSSATPKDFSNPTGSDTFAACRHDVSEGNRSSKMTELNHQERIQSESDTSEQGVKTDSLVP